MKTKFKGRIDFLLTSIILLSIFLNFYQLTKAGSNTYYTVAVKSMLKSFHAFFYASFDPVGFITVDKPPVALWIQTLSASIFGLSNFSVLLPEALAGVISVWLMYVVVKPKFGRTAALLSSLVLACTPIFVAVVRTNNVDSILILTLLIATWALMKSVDQQKVSWLLVSVILVGIGFNIKMLQAYMVLPAFYLFYFIAVKAKWTKRIGQLTIATVVLAAVSLSWAVIVDSTSKDQRPYIGSSQTNSVLELALGYNGISRLTGDQSRGKAAGNVPQMPPANSQGTNNISGNGEQPSMSPADSQNIQKQTRDGNPSFAGGPRGGKQGGMNGMFGTGTPGAARLFSKELSGQASWLLPLVLFAGIALVVSFRKNRAFTLQHQFAIFWLTWLLPMMVFFSIANFFHQYYLSMMGPAIAALTGIGWTMLWNLYKEKQGWQSWLLPVSVLATSLFEALILFENKNVISQAWIAVPIILGLVFSVLLIVMRQREKTAYSLSIAGMLVLLIFPFYWTLATILDGGNSALPIAGPNSRQSGGMGGGGPMMGARPAWNGDGSMGSGLNRNHGSSMVGAGPNRNGGGSMMESQADAKLISYLKKHYNGETFMLATESTREAYPFMLQTDYAVMAMGGFSGNDPAVTPEKLAKMTKDGEVKYFLISGEGRGNQKVNEWIKANAKEVPSSEWQSSQNTDNTQRTGMNRSMTLYEYKG
ncbi:glycosyltransferase family 39 protein [Ectobacillus panaciterrae]|uniref:glycosyltransferase family 39 protein n=1 Tax=Ectobacillus panaciterrae TaxID=363872 RepID=UPI0004231A14|nr:glycosyltransferase family 39 protein [Ectobacillus panaciterrae]